MLFALTISIDKDVIKVYYHKNVAFFSQDLIAVALERGWYIGQFKKHDLIFEVAIAGFEGPFLFVSFPDPHSMVGIC